MRKRKSPFMALLIVALVAAVPPTHARNAPKPPVSTQSRLTAGQPTATAQSLMPKVKVVEPKAGATPYVPGWPLLVRWNYSGNPSGLAKVVLMKGNVEVKTLATGTSWGTGGVGVLTTTMPEDAFGFKSYTVKVFSPTSSDYSGTSEAFIAMPVLKVQAPISNGQTWKVGETHTVTWKYSGGCGNAVSIKAILTSSQWAYDLQNNWPIGSNWNGSFAWTIPASIPAGEYRIYLKSVNSAGNDRTAIFNIVH